MPGPNTVCDMPQTLSGIVPGIIDAHIHQWDPFTTPREASRLAPLYKRAPGLFERLLPVLLPAAGAGAGPVRAERRAAVPAGRLRR